MGRLSTHVLDTTGGRPAAGVKIELFRTTGKDWRLLKSVVTNADGRTEQPLLTGEDLIVATYRLEFHTADYFRRVGAALADPPFLDVVPVQIGIADPAAHYHVPLLCTPWSYIIYRGS
ncbi:MAG: hydroxyisourate hydrolase [Deltaproteobacteria bacterium]|nr:hydroxyisourate hydrolase [Deltaproteobacteria bacterium]